MKLYHGTSSKYLEAILRDGLCPRRRMKGNWTHSVSSNSKAVYLTSVYSIYFAQCAVNDHAAEKLVVVEVDTDLLDQDLFAPDEDFLEQASRSDENIPVFGHPMKKRNVWFRTRMHMHYQHLWEKSISLMGVGAYFGIVHPAAFTRIAILPFDHPIRWSSDPIVCPQNHHIMGGFYRNLTKHLFGDTDFEQNLMWSRVPGIKDMPHRNDVEVRSYR